MENLPAGPQPLTMCFPSSESAFWHCLRHPGRSEAKGLLVLLLPVFRRFCSFPEWGWLRRGYQPRGKWAVAALDLLKFQGNFAAYFIKKKYSSIWSSLIPIKQIFLLQALWCLWCIHKSYIQHVKIRYWSRDSWLCRSWFINTFWSKTFIWIGTWIQIPLWQGCTVLTSSIHSEWFFTSH